ncbi:MAG: hypothetical protein WDN50_01825 [Bradyrhizobium sp.]
MSKPDDSKGNVWGGLCSARTFFSESRCFWRCRRQRVFSCRVFVSYTNIRSMLLLAAFLGIASLGQTLCALLGGIDMSIPYVIGSSNILLASLLNWGVPSFPACLIVLAGGVVVGILNGLLSFRLQGQALIVTFGVGLAIVGGSQIVTSIGSVYAGTVLGAVQAASRHVVRCRHYIRSAHSADRQSLDCASDCRRHRHVENAIRRSFYAVGGNRQAASRVLFRSFAFG